MAAIEARSEAMAHIKQMLWDIMAEMQDFTAIHFISIHVRYMQAIAERVLRISSFMNEEENDLHRQGMTKFELIRLKTEDFATSIRNLEGLNFSDDGLQNINICLKKCNEFLLFTIW